MKKWYWVAAVCVAADQALKALALTLAQPVTLIPGVLALTCTHNTGMAFSLFSGQTLLLGVLSAAAVAVGYLILRRYCLGAWSRPAAMLMLGGAVGNMIDRFARGYVVDLFETLFVRFPVFNAADAFLTVGAGMMMISLLFRPDEWREKNGSTEA